jgi:hypothetical protein
VAYRARTARLMPDKHRAGPERVTGGQALRRAASSTSHRCSGQERRLRAWNQSSTRHRLTTCALRTELLRVLRCATSRTIDSELRVVAVLRRAARERGGPLPLIDVADALLDERRAGGPGLISNTRWVLAGDDRGIYGDYTPKQID